MTMTKISNVRRAVFSILLVTAALALSNLLWISRAQEQRDCPVKVTLLQVNDVYQFAPVDGGKNGGLGRVLTLRKQVLSESPHTMFLLAGDTISPSIESNTYKGSQMIEAWNLIGLDYATFGNHEFDFGPEVLLQRVGESKFKWLAANVTDKTTGKLFADTPEFIVREFDGVKVGMFGIVLRDTLKSSRPGANIDIGDPCATAARVVPKIRAAGAQVIVALTHLAMSEDKQLAQCADVDVIIGGHEHTLLESLAGRTPIFKMTSDAREVGRIDLNISRSTGKLESIDWKVMKVTDQVPEDVAFAPLNEKYGPLLKSLEEPLGRTTVELNMKSEEVRTRETNLGDFVADAFKAATGADVALVNGGSIRADTTLAPGQLTRRHVLSILPFNNKVLKIQVTGAVLRQALEFGVASLGVSEEQPGRFPQVAGIRFTYDVRLAPGARITNVTVNGKPLDDRSTYTLAAASYIAGGGDGYEMLKTAQVLVGPDKAPAESDILLKAVSSVASIAPGTDGRITRVDIAKAESDCQTVTVTPAQTMQAGLDRDLLNEISKIRAIDNHAHPLKYVAAGEKRDDEYDALPLEAIPAFALPVRLNPANPEFIRAWHDLYRYSYDDMSEAHVRELMTNKKQAASASGDRFPAWVLDQLNIETMFANRVAMGQGLVSPRFRWVSFVDALIFPLNNEAARRTNPDHRGLYPPEERLLKRYLSDLKVRTLPLTLDLYLKQVVTPTLERQKRNGAVAVKFEAAYLRPLDFDHPDERIARATYARYARGGEPSAPNYKILQDFLFYYVAREAGRLGMAVHIHCFAGAGANYIQKGSNPMLLETAFNDPTLRKTNFVVIHGGYPYTKEMAGLLIKPNVYADFSGQTFFLYPRELSGVLRNWMELYPDKILFGTDAFSFGPEVDWGEVAWLSNTSARQALTLALSGMIADGEVDRVRALELAGMVLRENAIRLYGLNR